MKKSCWYDVLKYGEKSVRADALIDGSQVSITLKNGTYNVAALAYDFNQVSKENKFIKININISSDNLADIKFLVSYFKDEKEVFKGYITPGEKTIMPEGVEKIVFTALISGKNGGKVLLSEPSLKECEQVNKRKAKLSALSLPYIFLKDIGKATVKDLLEMNFMRIDALVRRENPDLIVLTETFLTRRLGVPFSESFIKEDSIEMNRIREKAKQHNVYLAFSIRETDDDGFFYNTAYLIGRNGEIVAKYRKTHLTMEEKLSGLVPGDKCVVADADFGRIGFAICWDLFFNDYVKKLATMGAEIIINPTAGFHLDMNSMRAQDNGVYIVSSGTSGDKTAIIGPEGQLLSMNSDTGYAVYEVDLRETFPVRYLSSNSYSLRYDVYANEKREDLY